MLDYAALTAVSAVIREGSFEGAARLMGLTASAVSQRVRGYEERLGSLLIIRGSPCLPTDLGRSLCAHVDKVRLLEADIPYLSERVATEKAFPVSLKIAVNADSLATWFPEAIASFTKQSSIFLELYAEDESHTADHLRSGAVMAAITAEVEPIIGCKVVKLGQLRYIACASPNFVEQFFPNGFTPHAFQTAPCICFDRKDSLQSRWLETTQKISLPKQVHYVPSTQGFLDFIVAGLGWGLQPLFLARNYLAQGLLRPLGSDHFMNVDLYWVYPRLKSKVMEELTRHLIHYCNSMMDLADKK
ncbi:LysR family transcriptional regulator ArgP [Acetobacter orientalis]|uniref:LysR family transcriptional regulator n=4 Tax=Acetobacter orientalis TaxID=146474 RepID=A0A2Z5ZLM4_9PROT|nr:LysR family transcriptional regulator ArgP [Acetobacter orientalis]BBC81520.1 LysR family transcriptional regulator [Acetobacter orientalis]GAN65995.1 transcriptional regulator LysR/chromosome replication initiation inhibitor [Acetobacter orientalis]GBR17423.1 transcriptional regulator [Acetobacter orientalis NRIC 0481]GEL60332.1 transcriptional regulator ArgP [Acetobacter orientalis]